MQNFMSLMILDLFKPLFNKLGIQYDKMRLILQMKLTLDRRKGKNENGKNIFLQSLIIYFFIGVIASRIILMEMDLMTKMTFSFSFLSIMLFSAFISDFSSVILDTSDKYIIGVADVDSKTLNMARMIHIIIYMSILSFTISGFSLIMALLKYNSMRFFLVFALCIILIDFLLVVFTSLFYYVIIRLFKGERLKDVVNLFQIVILMVFFVAYYIITSIFGNGSISYVHTVQFYNLFVPFMWFASLFCVLFEGRLEFLYVAMSILAVVVPLIFVVLYINMTSVFEKNLEKMEAVSVKDSKPKKSLVLKISRILCRNNEERAFFNFIYTNLSRDREFKKRVYPTMLMAALLPIVVLFSYFDRTQSISSYINSLEGTNYFLAMYMGVIILQNYIVLIKYSNEHEASFIYDMISVKARASIYSAQFKVIIIKLFLPIFVVMGAIFVYIFKIAVVKHLLIIFVSTIFISIATFRINKAELPFSKEYIIATNSANIINSIKSIVFVGIFSAIHYLIIIKLESVYSLGYLFLLIFILVFGWRRLLNFK